jgi:hypothetical protein
MTGMVKKVLTWVVVGFVLFFIATRPASAAEVFKNIGSGLMNIATGFGDFFAHLVA